MPLLDPPLGNFDPSPNIAVVYGNLAMNLNFGAGINSPIAKLHGYIKVLFFNGLLFYRVGAMFALTLG